MAPKTRKKTGPPSSYRPEYCARLHDHMAEGLSFEAFAGLIGVTSQTLRNWAAAEPAFEDARARGKDACRLWWERLGQQGTQGFGPEVLSKRVVKPDGTTEEHYEAAKFNTGTWIFNMKNRFPDEWKERHEIDIGVDLNKLSDVERAKIVAEAVAALTPTERTQVLDLLQDTDGVYRPAKSLPEPAKDGGT